MKILVLEADMDLRDRHPFTEWVEHQKEAGHEVRMVTNAYHNGVEVISQIEWPDRVAFTSTFIYINAIYELSLAIAKHRSRPLEMWIMNNTLEQDIQRLVEIHADTPKYVGPDPKGRVAYEYEWEFNEEKAEQYGYAMRHIVISELNYDSYDREEKTKLMHQLHGLGLKWQMKLDDDKDFLLSRSQPNAHTGRMIRIKPGILQSSPGQKWSNLKPGMIVPELSMLGASEHVAGKMTDRGAWVMGVDEPVKILNDDPGYNSRKYDEFEYVIHNIDDCATELLKMCGREMASGSYYFVTGVLRDDSPEMTAHWKATVILDEFGLPRRQNRAIMEMRIEEFENMSKNTSKVKA